MPPELSGLLSRRQAAVTACAIADGQLRSGCIPGTPGGAADPWNHVEAAMALDVAGLESEAERAYFWLAATQRSDGSWGVRYRDEAVVDRAADANFCAYVATGAWHHHLATGDGGFLAEMWPTIEAAVEFALGLQAPSGEVLWARDAAGQPSAPALLTSSSCIHLSLGCALEVAAWLGLERPAWGAARHRLAHAIRYRPQAFGDRARYSMDWYYPVLGGVVTGDAARARLAERWDTFVVPGRGVRCVADEPWVTGADQAHHLVAGATLSVCAVSRAGPGSRLRSPASWCSRWTQSDGGRRPCNCSAGSRTCAGPRAPTGWGPLFQKAVCGPKSSRHGPRRPSCWRPTRSVPSAPRRASSSA